MQWTAEAETAIKRVPFFVRKKVRQRVESEAAAAGKRMVTLADVQGTRKRYLASMAGEIKGYQLDTCFGPDGCPNRAMRAEALVDKLEPVFKDADLLGFLRTHVTGPLKFHHEFRVTVAECPNACSQPQIKDIGIIGAVQPALTREACSQCHRCIDICPDGALCMAADGKSPVIDVERCLSCGKCVDVCPTGTLSGDRCGYRVLVGGKLGRHPRLAEALPGIYTEEEVVRIVQRCLTFYKDHSREGLRFADLLSETDINRLVAKDNPS